MTPRRLVLWFGDELQRIRQKTLASVMHSVFGAGSPKENERYTKQYLIDAILALEEGKIAQDGGMYFYEEELGRMRRQYLEHIASTYWGLATYNRLKGWSKKRLIRGILEAQKAGS